MHPDPPDDRITPYPHHWVYTRSHQRGALVRSMTGRPRTSTNPRAAYWRAHKKARRGD